MSPVLCGCLTRMRAAAGRHPCWNCQAGLPERRASPGGAEGDDSITLAAHAAGLRVILPGPWPFPPRTVNCWRLPLPSHLQISTPVAPPSTVSGPIPPIRLLDPPGSSSQSPGTGPAGQPAPLLSFLPGAARELLLLSPQRRVWVNWKGQD